jgi:deoxyribodipyrimidine photo-lyase
MIQNERVRRLNRKSTAPGDYVLYWMQSAQRVEYNHALEYAIQQANQRDKPLVVFFGLTDEYPDANERHYYFLLQGLREVADDLEKRGIGFVVQHVSPEAGVVSLAQRAGMVIADDGYTTIQRQWRHYVARNISCPLIQVETNVVVPVETVSRKEEYAARTIRPKIHKHLNTFLVPLKKRKLKKSSLDLRFPCFDIRDTDIAIAKMNIDHSVSRVDTFKGGTGQAKKRLRKFIRQKLDYYAEGRNDPNADCVSHMSPYLHFGQISPLYIALQIRDADSPGKEAYLEELIVRRELAINFVRYNRKYHTFASLPNWARINFKAHGKDKREYIYSLEELETAHTHDPYWNAAQMEMVHTGKMHGYMRMYWGKKILQWTRSVQQAYKIAVYLNDKYELDGRDPNGYAGVAWCFGKHDRPWTRRSIFGSVRYMNAQGLQRKFDADAYVDKVSELTKHRKT